MEKEKRKAQKIIRQLTPKESDHRAYIKEARFFLREYSEFSRYIPPEKNNIYRFSYIQSKIFQRKYLLANIKENWLEDLALNCDAIASPSLIVLGMMSSPPLILIPGDRPLPRSSAFRSILEHEIVHVNQALKDKFPEIPSTDGTKDLIEDFFDYTRAEYEANLIQLTQWPDAGLWPSNEIALDAWCILRGYTAGLENIMSAYISSKTTDSDFFSFLARLPGAILSGFKKRELDHRIGEEYIECYPVHLKTAFLKFFHTMPHLHRDQRFIKISRWIIQKWPEFEKLAGGS